MGLLAVPSVWGRKRRPLVEVDYDRFEDTTTVSTDANLGWKPYDLTFAYVCQGHTSHCRPMSLELWFWSIFKPDGSNGDYLPDFSLEPGLILIIDGRRLRLGRGLWKLSQIEGDGQSVRYRISIKDYLSIVSAKSVEGRIGGSYTWRLKLNPKSRKPLQALAAEMRPAR